MADRTYAHFIGVGGAGMSGIALVLQKRGVLVTGSDLKESRYSRQLTAAGVPVTIGHSEENLGDPEVVVVSSAIPERNPELAAARARGIEVWPRAKMLANLAGEAKTLAVAGTHGKTTTSSMLATMLHHMKLDPTFLIGGEVDGFGVNGVNGLGEHFVVEADESDGSFMYLEPYVSLVTNIEEDHLDHYESLDEIEDTFVAFMSRTSADGAVVVCADEARLLDVASRVDRRIVSYGFDVDADVRCVSYERQGIGYRFDVRFPDGRVAQCRTVVPGEHNVSNAVGVLAVAWFLGLDVERAGDSLSEFTGVRRRFDLVAEVGGVAVVDDYAHHPTEVRALLKAAKGLGYGRVWAIFQPHRYSRTQSFARDFGDAFSAADHVVVTNVYSAGETPIPGVSGKTVVFELLKRHPRAVAAYLPHRDDIVNYVVKAVRPGDLVLTVGAGDVTSLGPRIAGAIKATMSETEDPQSA